MFHLQWIVQAETATGRVIGVFVTDPSELRPVATAVIVQTGDKADIRLLRVVDRYQRHGIGTLIINQLKRVFRRLIVNVEGDVDVAKRFLVGCGFRHVSTAVSSAGVENCFIFERIHDVSFDSKEVAIDSDWTRYCRYGTSDWQRNSAWN